MPAFIHSDQIIFSIYSDIEIFRLITVIMVIHFQIFKY